MQRYNDYFIKQIYLFYNFMKNVAFLFGFFTLSKVDSSENANKYLYFN